MAAAPSIWRSLTSDKANCVYMQIELKRTAVRFRRR